MTFIAPLSGWWFRPVPLARVDIFRTLVYVFLIADVLAVTSLVVPHSYASPELYQPVDLLSAGHQPAPTPLFAHVLRGVVIGSALVAASGRLPRLSGWVAAIAYLDWSCLAMSYGKVDHDHLAVLVAVFVLPTVPHGRWRASGDSAAAGWAARCVEVAVVATYFLSAYAKMRFGGWHWPLGATFTWAVLRRGTSLGDHLLGHPQVLRAAQWGLLTLETATLSLLFLSRRWRVVGVVVLLLFHLTTWLTIRIHFLPLVVCLLIFLPLERATGIWRRGLRTTGPVALPA